jgi:outer membrane protein OmpA-like peptidoglycan-associated protein
VKAEAGSEKWELTVSQSKGPIKIFKGIGQPPSVIEWDLAKEQENIPRFDEPLLYKLEVIDKDNKRWASNVQQLPVEQMTIEKKMNEMLADKEFDRFSLILFDFNKFDLNEANLRIAEFAKKRIKKNSTVSIKGYTDRMGDENHNLQLSLKRAQSTAKILGVDFKYVIGLGETLPLLYNNDVPEGRFYCRTVNIEIVTPIQ